MSNRAATILAVAAVISSLCLYATFAQDAPRAPEPEDGAIVLGRPPIRLSQELPGRYQLSTVMESTTRYELILLDTHTGQCWARTEGQRSWNNLGSPAKGE